MEKDLIYGLFQIVKGMTYRYRVGNVFRFNDSWTVKVLHNQILIKYYKDYCLSVSKNRRLICIKSYVGQTEERN